MAEHPSSPRPNSYAAQVRMPCSPGPTSVYFLPNTSSSLKKLGIGLQLDTASCMHTPYFIYCLYRRLLLALSTQKPVKVIWMMTTLMTMWGLLLLCHTYSVAVLSCVCVCVYHTIFIGVWCGRWRGGAKPSPGAWDSKSGGDVWNQLHWNKVHVFHWPSSYFVACSLVIEII